MQSGAVFDNPQPFVFDLKTESQKHSTTDEIGDELSVVEIFELIRSIKGNIVTFNIQLTLIRS
jgi:dihydroneopterin aldolase